ncbi:MAG: DUF3185 family protein [Thalassobaculum sp.]|jgi:hypothetical protein
MTSKRAVGLAIAVVGAVLLGFGLSAADAPLSDLRYELTGQYSGRTMLQIAVGAAALVVGTLMAVRGRF